MLIQRIQNGGRKAISPQMCRMIAEALIQGLPPSSRNLWMLLWSAWKLSLCRLTAFTRVTFGGNTPLIVCGLLFIKGELHANLFLLFFPLHAYTAALLPLRE